MPIAGQLSKTTKVYVGWAVIVATGLAGFIAARNQVVHNRTEVMRSKQRVRDAHVRDGLEKQAMYPPSNPPWRFAATLVIACRSRLAARLPFDYKLLLLRRSAQSSFMPNLYVFPGGGVDDHDFSSRWCGLFRKSGYDLQTINDELLSKNRAHILSPTYHPKSELSTDVALRITAIRETFEESGILVARRAKHGSSLLFKDDNENRKSWRRKVNENAENFVDMCEDLDVLPDVWALSEWSNWLTPTGSKATRRYDTIFYICTPEHTFESLDVEHDDSEMAHYEWLDPSEALLGVMTRALELAPPQIYEMHRLANFTSQIELENHHRARARDGLSLTFPKRYQADDGVIVALPGDTLYPNSPEFVDPEPATTLGCSVSDRRNDSRQHRIEMIEKGPRQILCNVELPYGQAVPIETAKLMELFSKSKI